jgi:hypothetical protein
MKNINNIVDITPNRDDIINIKDIQTLGTIAENGRKGCREKWSGQWKPLQEAKCRKRGVLEKRCFWKNAACGRIFD